MLKHGRVPHDVQRAGVAILLWMILGAVARVNAQGGPPMLTDDPGTPGNRRWEINAAFTQLSSRSEESRSFPHIDINYGLAMTFSSTIRRGGPSYSRRDKTGSAGKGWQAGGRATGVSHAPGSALVRRQRPARNRDSQRS
jgi:hypothetical protein